MRITIDVTEAGAPALTLEQRTAGEPSRATTSTEGPAIDGGAPPDALVAAMQSTTSGPSFPIVGARPGDGGGAPRRLAQSVGPTAPRFPQTR